MVHTTWYERLLPHLQPVMFPLGKVVYESGGRLDSVYFPTSSVVSLLYTTWKVIDFVG
jgi:hypothetical protein